MGSTSITDEANYDKRALYYWGKLYTEQLQAGQQYGELHKAIGIHILQFTSVPETRKYHNVFHIREKTEGFVYFRDLELHTVELAKFEGESCADLTSLVGKVKNALDMWVAFLTRHNLLEAADTLPPVLDRPDLKKALHELQKMNFSPEEREAYEGRLKFYLIEQDALLKQFNDGKAEGRAEGREEGIVEGKVKAFAEIGLAVEDIAVRTGVPLETVREILAQG
jgi:predicted transposase/invertase (TIGR01784 family)